jgi:hypothetical protein
LEKLQATRLGVKCQQSAFNRVFNTGLAKAKKLANVEQNMGDVIKFL